jgi:Fic-DOC domain mobile mystery protein B
MKFHYPLGATPLDPNESEALIPQHISLQSELNEWEHLNISEAEEWAFSKNHKDIFSVKFIQTLHKKMFNQTWRWAGNFRRTMKNIGVEVLQIPLELHKLCGDVAYQIDHKTIELDEIAVRLHHHLALIHAFPNGNGRHARLYTDTVLVNHGGRRFSWGKNDLSSPTRLREKYIEALQQADQHNFDPLLKFVRS